MSKLYTQLYDVAHWSCTKHLLFSFLYRPATLWSFLCLPVSYSRHKLAKDQAGHQPFKPDQYERACRCLWALPVTFMTKAKVKNKKKKKKLFGLIKRQPSRHTYISLANTISIMSIKSKLNSFTLDTQTSLSFGNYHHSLVLNSFNAIEPSQCTQLPVTHCLVLTTFVISSKELTNIIAILAVGSPYQYLFYS